MVKDCSELKTFSTLHSTFPLLHPPSAQVSQMHSILKGSDDVSQPDAAHSHKSPLIPSSSSTTNTSSVSTPQPPLLVETQIRAQAAQLKQQGNDHFKKGAYSLALACYTQAIEIHFIKPSPEMSPSCAPPTTFSQPKSYSPIGEGIESLVEKLQTTLAALESYSIFRPLVPDPSLYSNRAMVYEKMAVSEHLVIKDCSSAIEIYEKQRSLEATPCTTASSPTLLNCKKSEPADEYEVIINRY